MTVEELDLARAKDVAAKEYGDWRDLDDYSKDVCLEIVRAIRLGDEARDLRVVPVEATEEMLDAGGIGQASWHELLAASPYAPEPEEKG